MKNYPALVAFFIFLTGMVLAVQTLSVSAPVVFFCFFSLFAIVSSCGKKYSAAAAGILAAAIAGFFLMRFEISRLDSLIKRYLPRRMETCRLEGTLEEFAQGQERSRGIISADALIFKDRSVKVPGLKILVFFPKKSFPRPVEGQAVSFKTSLSPVNINSKRYFSLLSRGITGTAFIKKAVDIRLFDFSSSRSAAGAGRYFLKSRIERVLSSGFSSEDARNIYLALLIGSRSEMRQTLQEQFKKTNTFHIFSVSGFNFVVVVLSFLLIISILRVRESLRTPLLIVFALFYLFIVGAQVPSLRAFVMLVLLLLSKKVYRDYRVLNALGVTAILFAAADPLAVLTPSFQLSFSAVLGLATLGKWLSVKMDIFSARSPLDRLNKPAWYAPAWKHVSGVFSGCLAAWAFTTPVLLFHFKEVFLLSSLVNVFITPLVSIVTQMGVYSGFISLFFPFLSMIINMICEKMIFLILVTVDFFYSSLFCMIRGDRMAAWLWTAAAAGFTLYYLLEQQEIRRPQETQDI